MFVKEARGEGGGGGPGERGWGDGKGGFEGLSKKLEFEIFVSFHSNLLIAENQCYNLRK